MGDRVGRFTYYESCRRTRGVARSETHSVLPQKRMGGSAIDAVCLTVHSAVACHCRPGEDGAEGEGVLSSVGVSEVRGRPAVDRESGSARLEIDRMEEECGGDDGGGTRAGAAGAGGGLVNL